MLNARYNILTGDWDLVSLRRNKQALWGFLLDNHLLDDPFSHEGAGKKRAGSDLNPGHKDSVALTNDFSTMLPDMPVGLVGMNGLVKAENGNGVWYRVISSGPDSNLAFPHLGIEAVKRVIDLWTKEYKSIAYDRSIKYIQIFESKGEVMENSNPLSHGQIWAQKSLPQRVSKKTDQQKKYFEENKRSLLSNYVEWESKQKERIVLENDHFVALVPFWAAWPFETIIISKRHLQNITQLSEAERFAFADTIKRLTSKYYNLFKISFTYSAGIYQSPVNDGDHPEWHLHMHFYPPLLSSDVRMKYNDMNNPLAALNAEWAGKKLKCVSEVPSK